ncbi:MAG TPA: hypothetical protein VF618_22535 [Thermoanaerobaculia bacterium]
MKKNFRLLGLMLTFVLVFAAVATSPALADEGEAGAAAEAWICEDGCWSWDIENGCTQPVTCCANSSDGNWFCIDWSGGVS